MGSPGACRLPNRADGQQETYVGIIPPENESDWTRDEDTLDTWFSFRHCGLGQTLIDQDLAQNYELSFEDLLKQSKDFNAYHPTSVMETGLGHFILLGSQDDPLHNLHDRSIPFKDVYLHGMVRAEDGKKMSKSRPESIIDPLAVIPQYGTDALSAWPSSWASALAMTRTGARARSKPTGTSATKSGTWPATPKEFWK